MNNPLLQPWNTPFETPPFHLIEQVHFMPAVKEALKKASDEIKFITDNQDLPTFENTIATLDSSGETLGKITSILFNLNTAETNMELQAVAQEVSPLIARFSNDITLNVKLFNRIKRVFESKETSGLNTEQIILVERKFRSFMLGGAGLKRRGEKNVSGKYLKNLQLFHLNLKRMSLRRLIHLSCILWRSLILQGFLKV